MEQEVSYEDQAAAAIKLADNVRKLIRDEVKAALEDYGFLNKMYTYPLAEAVLNTTIGGNSPASNILARAIADKLTRYS